ncbi:MAG TPA: L,D-transpeptidase, partial [Actinomycetota bacterium]
CHGWEARRVLRRYLPALAACLALAACTSSPADVAATDEPISISNGPTGVNVAEPKPPLLPEGVDVLAVPAERVIPVWKHPKSAEATFELDTQNPSGSFSPMLIEGAKRRAGEAWYRVLLPLRPNGSAAWVRESDVSLRRIDQRIEVDLSDRTLRYYVHDDLKKHFRVGVGTDATPTGTGTFYVWVKIRYASPYQPYGIAALGLSGFSPVLSEWPGGGRMAIHGTSSPSDLGNAVSHGCVRVFNDDLKSLLDVPLGTPVEISR